jgi:hypothetical protein
VNSFLPQTNVLQPSYVHGSTSTCLLSTFPLLLASNICYHCYFVASYLLLISLDNDHQVTTKRNLWKHNMKHDAMNKFICRFLKTLVVTKMKHYNYLIDHVVWADHGRSHMRSKAPPRQQGIWVPDTTQSAILQHGCLYNWNRE